jgi:CMP-N,N'-diacetyllegionaminic acid synthase
MGLFMSRSDTVALIPARGGSKGIPDKNIKEIGGKPLIAWSIEQALASSRIDRVFVSTDSQLIAEIAQDYGAEVPFLRPSYLASDTASTESVMSHFLDWFGANEERAPRRIILLQPTSPVRLPGRIDQSIEQFEAEKGDALLSVSEQRNFLWKYEDGKPKAFYDFTCRPRRQDIGDEDQFWFENGSIYISDVEQFIKNKNRLFGNIVAFPMSDAESFEIDEPIDWLLVEVLIKAYL